jgi:hypothetical protein
MSNSIVSRDWLWYTADYLEVNGQPGLQAEEKAEFMRLVEERRKETGDTSKKFFTRRDVLTTLAPLLVIYHTEWVDCNASKDPKRLENYKNSDNGIITYPHNHNECLIPRSKHMTLSEEYIDIIEWETDINKASLLRRKKIRQEDYFDLVDKYSKKLYLDGTRQEGVPVDRPSKPQNPD